MTTPDPFASMVALGITAPKAPRQPAGTLRRPDLPPLSQAVVAWRDASTDWLRVDDADSAAHLTARRASPERPRVVVVGETNRGKSSLVNAMLGTTGLSPVDAGTATCTYLVFTHAITPYAVARFGGGMADISFPPKDLRAWATVDGEPDIDIPSPRWIEVGVASTLTAEMTVVDTPGVGGLIAAHAELAADAAASAAALLFVVDASAPFARGELEFLNRVSDRVEAVHFVVTKTDAYRGWREIIEADRLLLARHAPRFAAAQFHPVSSRLAEAAATQADPKIASMLLAQSGVVSLRSALQTEVAAVAAMMSDANIIRTSITVLAGAVAKLESGRRALTAGEAEADLLKNRRTELLGRRKAGTRGWQVMLRAEIQRARVDLTHETAREVREAAQLFRACIDAADNQALKEMAFHIDAYAQTMTVRAHRRLIDAMGRICHAVLAELFTQQERAVLVSQLATRPYTALVTRAPEKGKNVDDTIMTLSGASMGFSLSRLVTMVPAAALPAAFGIAMAPVSIILGGAAAFYMMKSRRRVADRGHLKQWLMEVLGEAKAQIDQNIAEQFIEADEQLTLALDDALTRQVEALDNEIKTVDGALKLDAIERAGRMRALDERRVAGIAMIGDGEAVLHRIRATRVAACPPAVPVVIRLPAGLPELIAQRSGPPDPGGQPSPPDVGPVSVQEPATVTRPQVRTTQQTRVSPFAGMNLAALSAAAQNPPDRAGADDPSGGWPETPWPQPS